MHLLALISIITVAVALPQGGYKTAIPGAQFQHGGAGAATAFREQGSSSFLTGGSLSGPGFTGGLGQVSVVLDESLEDKDSDEINVGLIGVRGGASTFGGVGGVECAAGELLSHDGKCTEAEVTRTIFVYDAPKKQFEQRKAFVERKPKLNYNIVFVHTPEDSSALEPIVVPPPQQKTLVYVLNKEGLAGEQKVIELPATVQKPEVFYINYQEGENPTLPIGIDLQTALASVNSQQPQVIGEIELDDDSSIEVRGSGLLNAAAPLSDLNGHSGTVGISLASAVQSLDATNGQQAGIAHESASFNGHSGTVGITLDSAVRGLGATNGQQLENFGQKTQLSNIYNSPSN